MSTGATDAFQALADRGRREILMMVAKEKRSINAIAENFDISRPAVSKHIPTSERCWCEARRRNGARDTSSDFSTRTGW